MRIKFLGIATFEVFTDNDQRILIDPFISDNPFCPVGTDYFKKLDILLISHGAYDHFGDAVAVAKMSKAKVICGAEVKKILVDEGVSANQIINLAWGLSTKINGTEIRAIESRHASFITDKNGNLVTGFPLGFIIDDGKRKLYNSSDTALFSDMKIIANFNKPNIGLMNVSVPRVYSPKKEPISMFTKGEMTGKEAALASKWLGLQYAVACHFEDPNTPDVQDFLRILKQNKNGPKPLLLKVGETFDL